MNAVIYPKPSHAASPLLGNARALGGALYVALVHADQECSRKRSRLSIVQCSSGCWAASKEPHRAPLGGEGHSTEAHESSHGDDTTVGVYY